MNKDKVPLKRSFSPVKPTRNDDQEDDFVRAHWGLIETKVWEDLEAEFRVIVLADAGAGKTFEAENRAKSIVDQGRKAFFIRIEDLDADFDEAFEVGSSEKFDEWLSSSEQAWFFLDSVDEARLENPRAFEKAIRRFAKRIHPASHRAHIVITSRPYAWRFKSDTELVERFLPFASLKQESRDGSEFETSEKDVEESPVSIYVLNPLSIEDIRQFAQHHSAKEIDRLITEIQRANLLEMASRPFDLEGLLSKWESDNELGGRLESLSHMVDVRLDEIDPSRSQLQPLIREKAREGVRMLAAAVTLSDETGILVPDIVHEKSGIDAEQVLADWEPKDVRSLLERGVFNGILYGAVRFRHRDTRELLTAEWLYEMLQKNDSRRQIESLLFRERYGEQVLVPRLRSILPWLILFDESILQKALDLHPEIAVEGGDAAHLPITTRKSILRDIVERIAAGEDDRSARNNSAILRIAQQDLSVDVHHLINKYSDNDDAIFFLGRLVWQGNMSDCLETLSKVAADPKRSIYPRIVSARAVFTSGTKKQKKKLWEKINAEPDILPRRLLAELLDEAPTDKKTIDLLLSSIEKLPPYEEYETSGLGDAIHAYLERFKEMDAVDRELLLAKLCDGLNSFLDREPHHERRECRVSTKYSWLMGAATHAVEILISDRAKSCFENAVIEILQKMPAISAWTAGDFNEYKSKLDKLIPDWIDFNDELFWKSVEKTRAGLSESGERLIDDWPVQWMGHYWQFDEESFHRVIRFIQERQFEDDRLVALALAFRIYVQSGRPNNLMLVLEQAVDGNIELQNSLDLLLNPSPSEHNERWEKERKKAEQKRQRKRLEQQKNRAKWVKRLRANPDVVRKPPDINPGEWTNDQYWLLREIDGEGLRTERGKGTDWRVLIDEFGEDVARAFRDAAMRHWRVFTPELRSEGADTTSTPYALIFGLKGLEFESRESEDFPQNLTDIEISHALRYLTRELNGFPSWLEDVFKTHPEFVLNAVWKELSWELENTKSDEVAHYILQDIVYHAPWLHEHLAAGIQKWVENNLHAGLVILRSCFKILESAQVPSDWFAALAKDKVSSIDDLEELPTWYALWVDTAPNEGIDAVANWLDSLKAADAVIAAQRFVTQLIGDRHSRSVGTFFREFFSVLHLRKLYLLIHKYIRVEEDISRSEGGVYEPTIRDDAQDARNRLLNMLAEIPGKETYVALLDLSCSQSVVAQRPWIVQCAKKRAETDADLEPWTAKQVSEFSSLTESKPASHKQLFDIGVLHLNDFKDWLERGNDSLYEVYQRVEGETEMRKVVANWITNHASGRYICTQESTLANDQRPDIWLHNTQVVSPVPIELKLLDKGWSGPDLCERLRNQLAGDYLREETAGCGIFLLVWQGKGKPDRRWRIDGKLVKVSGLKTALTNYWDSISERFINVAAIKVIVVDLTLRSEKSDL